MSIFVDPNETFTIGMYYKELRNNNNELESIDVSEDFKDGYKKITTKFSQASADVFSKILEEATIVNHVSQEPIMRTRVLRDYVLSELMKSWDVVDDDGEVIPININTVGSLNIIVANYLFLNYIKRSQLEIMLKSISKGKDNLKTILNRQE